jgi:hypothetical protein
MLKLDPQHLQTINLILAKYPYQFAAFGSRVKGKAGKFADLDLCCKPEIS